MKKKPAKRGRPKKVKEVQTPESIVKTSEVIVSPVNEVAVGEVVARCACGEPVAEGQNAVCKKHIKAN